MLTERCRANSIEEIASLPVLLRAYECRAASEIASALQNMQADAALGSADSFMAHLVDHYAVSKSHGLVSIVSSFIAAVDKLEREQPAVAPVMGRLAALFALSWIERDLGSFLLSGHLSAEQAAMIKPAQASLLEVVRPDAMALVDAFGRSDYELNSAIGRSDGKYIEALYEIAQKEPLNAHQELGFDQGHLRFMKDIIHGTSLDDSRLPAARL